MVCVRVSFALGLLGLAATGSLGCSNEPAKPGPEVVLEQFGGKLGVDVGGTAEVNVDVRSRGDAELTVRLADVRTDKYFGETLELKGPGRADDLGKVSRILYSARFTRPATDKGPCAGKESSLLLTLTRTGASPDVNGSLKAYCTPDAKGDEVDRILLKGALPRLK